MQAYFLSFRPHSKGRKQCEKDNYSEVMTKRRLPGLTDVAEVQPVLLVVCLVIYLTLVIGNVPTSLLLHSDSMLHTPVCFFLSHLPLLCRSVSCHQGHSSDAGAFLIQGKGKQISFLGCSIQFHFFIDRPGDHTWWLLQTTDDVITVMTSDHGRLPTLALWEQNVPKCLPLSHGYPYSHGFATGQAQTILMPCLSFLGPNEINFLYCADPPLFILPCSDMYENTTAMFAVAGFNLCCSLTPLSSSSPPTFLFSQPFCVTALMKGGPRLSPALGPICRLSLFFMGCPSAYIGGLLLKHP